MPENLMNLVMRASVDRRRFMGRAGLGLAGLATAASGVVLASTPARAQALTDAEIFNFALNFEYLGAQYYLAALGSALPSSLTGPGAGAVSLPSPTAVPFQNQAIGYFAQQLATDEVAHVTFIQEALEASGVPPIPQPAINLNTSWSTLATAAGLIVPGQTFSPFTSETNFLLGAYVLEDVCVTALCGAASLISSKTNLAYAASILGVEGYQVGMIRSRLSAIGAGAATDAISALRSNLSNAVVNMGVNDVGTSANGNAFNFTNADVNAQAFRRTPQEVLSIAYGGGTASGGFFPNGVNGAITTTVSA